MTEPIFGIVMASSDGTFIEVEYKKYADAKPGEAKKAELLEHFEMIDKLLTALGVPRVENAALDDPPAVGAGELQTSKSAVNRKRLAVNISHWRLKC